MKELTWEEIKKGKPKKFLTEEEYKIYAEASKDFKERVGNMSDKKLKKFAETGLGISSMRYAKQFADPHKKPNLYKSVYALMSEYKY
jgi:hypothetical protein